MACFEVIHSWSVDDFETIHGQSVDSFEATHEWMLAIDHDRCHFGKVVTLKVQQVVLIPWSNSANIYPTLEDRHHVNLF